MSAYGTDQRQPGCTCVNDPDLARLAALIEDGVDQFTASRLLWGPPPAVVDVRAWVRAQFKATFPWLRLPRDEPKVRAS